MEQNDKLVLIYATFPSVAAASAIGEDLVKARLAACVNILEGIVSIYEWEGQLQRDTEAVAIVKTREDLAATVVATLKAAHSYENPAIVVLPVAGGSLPYLEWVLAQTRRPERQPDLG
jgi:periplasmic divalent cation tolerance protein